MGVARSKNTLQVLRANGTVWNMGSNLYGERGFPSIAATPPGPTQVPWLTHVTALSSQESHVHALRANGTLVGWGRGLLGDGISPLHPEPTRVPFFRR